MNKFRTITKHLMKSNPLPFISIISIVLSLSLALVSCNDEEDIVPEYQIPHKDVYSFEVDSIQAEFALLNARGEQATTFAYGEDIIFDLKVYNNGNYPFWRDVRQILGNDMFRVYRSNGHYEGTPWHYDDIGTLVFHGIAAHSMKHWQCPWSSASAIKPTPPLMLNTYNHRLSKGSYYAVAPVHIYDYLIGTCVIHFNIK